MKEIISTTNAPSAIGPYSQAVKLGNLLFTAGQIALDPSTGDMKTSSVDEEVHQIMGNLKAVAEAAGTSLDNVLKTTIYVTDLGLFGKINELYGSYFGDQPPARSTVEVAALPKGGSVEIDMIIHIP
ncbi:MAG: RutC family protein [Candidatus Heimdallarchaeota archaeon LC_2]|nr:MAG: RutC family protein [Candidatus Heimdallarchaeota archaeon LC_2]